MRTNIVRVVLLLSSSAFSFPFFANGQGLDAVPSIVANEAGARLALKEKNSVFSMIPSWCCAHAAARGRSC